jgi:hypothetical protein
MDVIGSSFNNFGVHAQKLHRLDDGHVCLQDSWDTSFSNPVFVHLSICLSSLLYEQSYGFSFVKGGSDSHFPVHAHIDLHILAIISGIISQSDRLIPPKLPAQLHRGICSDLNAKTKPSQNRGANLKFLQDLVRDRSIVLEDYEIDCGL